MTNLDAVSVLGLVAATMTTGSWVPQAIHTIRTRRAGDLRWAYLAMFGTGVFLWLLYGIARRDLALILANGVTVVLISLIALVKARTRG